MAGELQALMKIVDGVKELGKALLPEELEPKSTPKPPAADDVYVIPRHLLDGLIYAAGDDELSRTTPIGIMRPISMIKDWVEVSKK